MSTGEEAEAMTGRPLAHAMVHDFLDRIATDPKERERIARILNCRSCLTSFDTKLDVSRRGTIPGKALATAGGVAQNRVGSATTETQKRQGGKSLALRDPRFDLFVQAGACSSSGVKVQTDES
jgi:hypothetical protein